MTIQLRDMKLAYRHNRGIVDNVHELEILFKQLFGCEVNIKDILRCFAVGQFGVLEETDVSELLLYLNNELGDFEPEDFYDADWFLDCCNHYVNAVNNIIYRFYEWDGGEEGEDDGRSQEQ